MARDFLEANAGLEAAGDARLTGRECFRCGKRIGIEAFGCWVSSPVTGGIALSAHRDCINGMGEVELAYAYQTAALAAITGEKERVH